MAKKKDLADIFQEKRTEEQVEVDAASPSVVVEKKDTLPATRQGKRILSGWFDPEVHRQLRMIAASEDKTLERVMGDAFNAFFATHGIPPIA